MGPGKKVVKGREIRQNSLAGSCKVTLLGRTVVNIFIRRFPWHWTYCRFVCHDGLPASHFYLLPALRATLVVGCPPNRPAGHQECVAFFDWV